MMSSRFSQWGDSRQISVSFILKSHELPQPIRIGYQGQIHTYKHYTERWATLWSPTLCRSVDIENENIRYDLHTIIHDILDISNHPNIFKMLRKVILNSVLEYKIKWFRFFVDIGNIFYIILVTFKVSWKLYNFKVINSTCVNKIIQYNLPHICSLRKGKFASYTKFEKK